MTANYPHRNVPKEEPSLLYGNIVAFRTDDRPLGVELAADNNVMKVTRDCLFICSCVLPLAQCMRSAQHELVGCCDRARCFSFSFYD